MNHNGFLSKGSRSSYVGRSRHRVGRIVVPLLAVGLYLILSNSAAGRASWSDPRLATMRAGESRECWVTATCTSKTQATDGCGDVAESWTQCSSCPPSKSCAFGDCSPYNVYVCGVTSVHACEENLTSDYCGTAEGGTCVVSGTMIQPLCPGGVNRWRCVGGGCEGAPGTTFTCAPAVCRNP